jgi:hypothetical protein
MTMEQQAITVDRRRHPRQDQPELDWGDVSISSAEENIPSLHDAFSQHRLCASTRAAVTLGEGFRSGRWWGAKPQGMQSACRENHSADGAAQEPPAFERCRRRYRHPFPRIP